MTIYSVFMFNSEDFTIWEFVFIELVVNCFQNCILAYNSQLVVIIFRKLTSCELLSKLYFSL